MVSADMAKKLNDGEDYGYDAIVVGSGYGGSVAACRMAMAGIKVCLIEKGRRWKAEDFPTDTMKILSNVRMENRNLGFRFGPKDALFQIHEENDSLAAVACGLGGGSLISAGVMLPTPVRARRNPKWPIEWEKDWDICEASAAAMLGVQSVPVKFPFAKVMEEIADVDIERSFESSLKLSVNFDLEEPLSNSLKAQQMGSCLACGNCLSGCPYNAKNSTDKNYIVSAFQAGCAVRTECEVQYVVENPQETYQSAGIRGRKRRWLVFLNDIDCITADFVILSAGVFGTAEILFRSQMRGLRLSEALGSGFSCNGNNVAYLAGSTAPLNGFGLDKKQFSKIPFQERPGPSISSSYTSASGFTVQSAVLPRAYPLLLFKGIATYGWPNGYWFLHGVIDNLKQLIGLKSSQAMVLNAMGYDDGNGKIIFEKDTENICFRPPNDPLLPRKIEAFQKLAKKFGGILFMSRYRSTSVHLLGGCNVSADSASGVCNHKGQIFDAKTPASVHPGLYACDASIIPCPVGINPCLTIAAAAEHVSQHLVQDSLGYKIKRDANPDIVTVNQDPYNLSDKNIGADAKSAVLIKETMKGFVGGMPCTAHLKMNIRCENQTGSDQWNCTMRGSFPVLRGRVGGYLVFRAVEEDKLHIIDGEVDMCVVDQRTPYTQYMRYSLLLAASSGSRYILEGKKTMNPYLFALCAWKETTTLYVTFKQIAVKTAGERKVKLKGELKVSLVELLRSFLSLRGSSRDVFTNLLLRTLFRTYILQVPQGISMDLTPQDASYRPYPSSSLHQIKTEDGCVISCRRWKSGQNQLLLEGKQQLNPVLLLNGHSKECYWLPTEPQDLVRTLLEEGHEVWLLQPRLHPLNPANSFTIDDIAQYDIPAVIKKILELHGKSIKIHVVAHCVGGLAIHMALMGGHICANHIASLSCTNSSMFFKLNALSRVKMWLPLIPISVFLLGKNTVLSLLEDSKDGSRHSLLKLVARHLPRYERCTSQECEIFSGIFGNIFWHENVSPVLHHWLNKQNMTELPMADFPHLRKICNMGLIVDSKGDNSYLIHPERMAVSTLYLSGGRSLLVTPETSFLANKYMRLHQPSFRHERVVVDGFGHSDLLIGEKSSKKVFPHILSHIRLAEQEGMTAERKKHRKEALEWGSDPYEGCTGLDSWFSPSVTVFLFLLFALLLAWFLV